MRKYQCDVELFYKEKGFLSCGKKTEVIKNLFIENILNYKRKNLFFCNIWFHILQDQYLLSLSYFSLKKNCHLLFLLFKSFNF